MLQRFLNWSGSEVSTWYVNSLLCLDVRRHAPLPAGPKIIAANHPTTSDPFILMGLVHEPMRILISRFCFTLPLLGGFLRGAAHVPVDKGRGREAFEAALGLLEAGRTIGIFPEGALSPVGGGLGMLRTGVARLALSSGAPIVPVGIAAQHARLWRRDLHVGGGVMDGARWAHRGHYAVTIGEPQSYLGDPADRDRVQAVLAHLEQRLASLAHESAARADAARSRGSGSGLRAGACQVWGACTAALRTAASRARL
ncbi:MAG: lysophospholipid acyltransferase family protein [Anaerolineae bacterium]